MIFSAFFFRFLSFGFQIKHLVSSLITYIALFYQIAFSFIVQGMIVFLFSLFLCVMFIILSLF